MVLAPLHMLYTADALRLEILLAKLYAASNNASAAMPSMASFFFTMVSIGLELYSLSP